MLASARFASFRIPSPRPRSSCFALLFPHRLKLASNFSPPSRETEILRSNGVGLKADAAFVAASFHWVTATARERSIDRSAAISAPANQIFPVDPVFLFPSSAFSPLPTPLPLHSFQYQPSQSPPLDQILSRRYDIFAKYECIPILMDPSIRTFREKVRLVPGKPPSLFSDPPFPRASRSGIVAPYLWRNRWELGIRAISLGRLCTPLTYGPEVAVRTGRPRQISLLIPRIFVSSCLASGPIPPGLSRNNRRDSTRR